MKRKSIAVVGLGNILFQDEGAGYHAISLLKEHYPGLPVDLIHAGTGGFTLLHQFVEREKIIFIDSGYCEAQPGEFRRFTHSEVTSIKQHKGYSLHEFDLMTLLSSAGQLGFLKGVDIAIYCIQVEKTGFSFPLRTATSNNLSNKVNGGLTKLVRTVYNECKEYIYSKGVDCINNFY